MQAITPTHLMSNTKSAERNLKTQWHHPLMLDSCLLHHQPKKSRQLGREDTAKWQRGWACPRSRMW